MIQHKEKQNQQQRRLSGSSSSSSSYKTPVTEYRKVQIMGPVTFGISIPSLWAKEHNLKMGQFMRVTVEENRLVIEPLLEEQK